MKIFKDVFSGKKEFQEHGLWIAGLFWHYFWLILAISKDFNHLICQTSPWKDSKTKVDFLNVILGDELFSDTYKMKLVDDCVWEVYGKVRIRFLQPKEAEEN